MKMAKQPKRRRKFLNGGDELNYLSDKICSHLQNRRRFPKRLEAILHRFHDILDESGLDDGSIMLQDHWALLHEAEGRMVEAIVHREREIELIEHLFSIGG